VQENNGTWDLINEYGIFSLFPSLLFIFVVIELLSLR